MALGSAAVELHNGFRLRHPISRERFSIVSGDILVGAISAHADRADDAGTSGAAGARRSRTPPMERVFVAHQRWVRSVSAHELSNILNWYVRATNSDERG